jgi:hypothetical protein
MEQGSKVKPLNNAKQLRGLLLYLIGGGEDTKIGGIVARVGARDIVLNDSLTFSSNRLHGKAMYERLVQSLERLATQMETPILWTGAGFPALK